MTPRVTVEQLRRSVEEFVGQRGAQTGGENWWREPLLVTARADDRFRVLPKIAAREHVMPGDLLPSARTVIVFFLPFRETLARKNRRGDTPCREWGQAYVDTNALISAVSENVKRLLAERGFDSALTPATHNFDPVRLISRWSHKHLGHLAGMGRFGHNAQLITPSGCTGRLGSLVTDADLGDHPLIQGPEACLHRAGRKCLRCVERCPVTALTVEGLDRPRCWERLKKNLAQGGTLAGLPETTHVCGKCVVMLPCSFRDPVAQSASPGLSNEGSL